jgi:dephospho-CoA kinase
MDARALLKSHGIGLTGGIATGKSTVAGLLRARGYLVVDADQLARAVVAPGTPGLAQVVASFGAGVVAPDGSLDRAKLRAIVFKNAEARGRLEAITHPLIRETLAEALAAAGLLETPRPFFYEAALLVETGTHGDFRALWATHCPRETQLARLMERDGASRADAERALASQMPAAEKAARADVALDTSCAIDELARRVDAALATLG